MSTNFYAASGEHIGKRHAAGEGRTSWSWAMNPEHFTKEGLGTAEPHCRSCTCMEGGTVAFDEYGVSYTWGEILAVVTHCTAHSTELVGREFC